MEYSRHEACGQLRRPHQTGKHFSMSKITFKITHFDKIRIFMCFLNCDNVIHTRKISKIIKTRRTKQDTNRKSEPFLLPQIMAGRKRKNSRASPLTWSVWSRLIDLWTTPNSEVVGDSCSVEWNYYSDLLVHTARGNQGNAVIEPDYLYMPSPHATG